jgi:Protein of unknown function (DUF2971)
MVRAYLELLGPNHCVLQIRHLNDPSELKYGLEVLQNTVFSLPADANWHHRCFMTLLLPHLVALMESSGIDLFVASFSTEKDDLGQWRAYADDGRGFAIGFDPKSLGSIGGSLEAGEHARYYGPVVYGENTIQVRNRAAIERAGAIIDRLAAENSDCAYYDNPYLDDKVKAKFMLSQDVLLGMFTAKSREERPPWANFLKIWQE